MKLTRIIPIAIVLFFCILPKTMKSCDVINGSDVVYRHLGGYTYHIKFILYHQCVCKLGIMPKFTLTCNGNTIPIVPPRTSIRDITPICSSGQPPCTNGGGSGGRFGIEEHIFEDTIDFSTSPYDAFLTGGCCEVYARVAQPWGLIGTTTSTTTYGGEAMMNLCNIGKKGNNSPTLSNIPITFICCNQTFSFNNGIYDNIDGDSLSFELTEPLSSTFGPVTWNAPLSKDIPLTPFCGTPGKVNCNPLPNAKPPRGFYFDKATGDMIVTPVDCNESGPVAIKINEYRKDSVTRKWIHLGFTRRDIFVTVVRCPNNNPPQITGKNPTPICEGNKICFTIDTKDELYLPNQTVPDTVNLSWNYGIPGATFRIIDPNAREKQAEFCWQTKIGDARDFAYQFTAIAKDDACPRPATTVRGFRVIVKPKAQSKRVYDLLDCGKLRFTSYPKDTVNFKGTYTYEWTIRDSTNAGVIYKKSFSKRDSFKFRRGGKYIITHQINNIPINCPTFYTDTVIIPPVLDVELAFGKDTFVCAGDSLKLKPIIAHGYKPFKYHWETPLGVHNPKDTFPTFSIKPNSTTSIMLKITDNHKCDDRDTIKVHHQPLPKVDIGTDKRICTYQSITLDAQNDDTIRYYWQPDGDSTRFKTVNVAGKYYVKVIDHLGCFKTDTMQLFVNDTVVAIAKPDREICILDTLKVKAKRRPLGHSRQFLWTDLNSGLMMASDSSFNTKITQSAVRKYDLYLRVTQGGVVCEDRDTLIITVNPLPTFKFAGLPPRCFTDGAINLTQKEVALAMPGNQAVRYFQKYKKPSWITGGPLGQAPFIYDYPKFITNDKVPATGLRDTICYDYRDAKGCINSDCKPIRLNPNPDVEVTNGIFCQKAGPIDLDKLVTKPFSKVGGIQTWKCITVPDNSGVDPADIVTDNGGTPVKFYMDPGQEGENQKTGDYFLEYCFKNPTTSCFRCDTSRVTVVRLPEIQFDPIPSQCINYPLLALDSFVIEKNSGRRFPSGTWQCVEYGNSRDKNNNLVNNAINNSVKNQKYFDPSTIVPNGGQYLLKFTDIASGCPVTDSTIINVNGLPSVDIKNRDTVCSSSGLLQLKSNWPDNTPDGVWSGEFVTGDKFDPSLSPKTKQYEGKYRVRYAYTNPLTKCTNKDSHDILVQSQPEVKIVSAKPYQQCENDVFTPEATKNFATSTTWTGAGDGTIISPKSLSTVYKYGIQDTVTGNVTLTITTDKEGVCPQASDNIMLIFEPIPQFTMPIGPDACEPAIIDFTSYVTKPYNSPNLRYTWDFGQGQTMNMVTNGSPTGIKYDTANRNGYNVKITVHNQWGAQPNEVCSTPLDLPAYVGVWPTPKADFTSDPESFTTVAFPKFKFFNKTKAAFGPLSYYWNFGNPDPDDTTNTSIEEHPIHFYPADTFKYYVFLKSEYTYFDRRENINSICWDTIGKWKDIRPDVTVFVPTAFSPEGTGPRKNNVFNAVVNGEKTFHIEVYNRWGELLWQSDNKYDTWDGKFKDADCQQDVYVWVVKVTAYDGEKYEYEGTVSLLR